MGTGEGWEGRGGSGKRNAMGKVKGKGAGGGGQRRESSCWPGVGREGFLEEVGIGPKGVDLAGDSEHK